MVPIAKLSGVRVAAVSAVVPAEKISLRDELQYFDGSDSKAARVTAVSGLCERRRAPEGVTASDLCLQAAQRLLTETGTDASTIEALFFVSQSPDYLLPASASILQHALGLSTRCAAMDMNIGCAGYVNGLWLASGMISSRACRRVLLLVGDAGSRFLNPANRVVAPVFGDAGTATLLERDENGQMMSFSLGNNGGAHEALVIPGGGARIPNNSEEGADSPYNRIVCDPTGNPWTLGGYGQLWMDGMAVFSFAVSVVPEHIKEHLTEAGCSAEALDFLVLHQGNRLMLETIAKKVSVAPEKAPWQTMSKFGNQGAASIPVTLCDRGIGGAENKRVLLCGFGAGLAWASCFLSLEGTRCLPVQEYELLEAVPGRGDLIAHWHEKFAGKL